MSAAVQTMLDVLNLEQLEVNSFAAARRRIAGSAYSADK